MQLAGQLFDGGDDARSGAIHGVTDYREMAIVDGIENAPAWAIRERIKIARGGFGVRSRKDEVVRLQMDNFFEAHLRPVLCGVDDGCGTGLTQRIGDECVSCRWR